MSLEQFSTPLFAGHQTFHPRFGWIKKGFDAANKDPGVFSEPDAPLQLGVGKNMVEAIRFWCAATRVTARAAHPSKSRAYVSAPTALGHALLGRSGLDPYFEDSSTLWILHWQAVSSGSLLPIWWSVFSDLTALEFTDDDLQRFCEDEVASTTWTQPSASSIKKDVDCLLRMYSTREIRGRQTIDDLLDSPFRELGLIVASPASAHSHHFVRGSKPNLAPATVAYACLDYLAMNDSSATSVSVGRLTSDPGSPGRLMKLTEDAILESLELVAQTHSDLRLAAPGGASQLVVERNPIELALEVMTEHHIRRGRSGGARVRGQLAGPQARLPLDQRSAVPAPRKQRGRNAPDLDSGSAA